MERFVAKIEQQCAVAERPVIVQVKGGSVRWFTGYRFDSYPLCFAYTLKVTRGGWLRNKNKFESLEGLKTGVETPMHVTPCKQRVSRPYYNS